MKVALVGGSRFASGGEPALTKIYCVTEPCELVAVTPMLQGLMQKLCCGNGTTPLIVAVPSPLSLKFSPSEGNSFDESVGLGTPVVLTVKFVGRPAVAFSVLGEMMLS
jgi:hypothetical protein